jgi:hypothetical protein
MTPEDQRRLARVEVTVEYVQKGLDEHKKTSEKRSDELKDMITKLGGKLDERQFKWSSLFTPQTTKALLYVVVSLAGAAGAGWAVKAADLLK